MRTQDIINPDALGIWQPSIDGGGRLMVSPGQGVRIIAALEDIEHHDRTFNTRESRLPAAYREPRDFFLGLPEVIREALWLKVRPDGECVFSYTHTCLYQIRKSLLIGEYSAMKGTLLYMFLRSTWYELIKHGAEPLYTWAYACSLWGFPMIPDDLLCVISLPSSLAVYIDDYLSGGGARWVPGWETPMEFDEDDNGESTAIYLRPAWGPNHESSPVNLGEYNKVRCLDLMNPVGSEAAWRVLKHIWNYE